MTKVILCTFCKNPYDLETRIPHVAPCGHSLCRECLRQLKAKKFAQCEDCGMGFSVYAFPTNICLKSQLEYTPSIKAPCSKEKVIMGESEQTWHCSECGLALHPRHARVCVKCTPSDIVENMIDGIRIMNYENAESHLVCPHCVMESKHRFHITKLYLPTKIKQVTNERFNDLFCTLRNQDCSREEIKIVEDAMMLLREKCVNAPTWSEFEEEWQEVETMAGGIIQMNSNISTAIRDVERALRQIEQCQQTKQHLMDQITYAISRNDFDRLSNQVSCLSIGSVDKFGHDLADRVAKTIKRHSRFSTGRDTDDSESEYEAEDKESDHNGFQSKLKRFAPVMDLSKADW